MIMIFISEKKMEEDPVLTNLKILIIGSTDKSKNTNYR